MQEHTMIKKIEVYANYSEGNGTTTINTIEKNGRLYCTKRQCDNALIRLHAAVGDHLRCWDHQYSVYIHDPKGQHLGEIS